MHDESKYAESSNPSGKRVYYSKADICSGQKKWGSTRAKMSALEAKKGRVAARPPCTEENLTLWARRLLRRGVILELLASDAQGIGHYLDDAPRTPELLAVLRGRGPILGRYGGVLLDKNKKDYLLLKNYANFGETKFPKGTCFQSYSADISTIYKLYWLKQG